MRIEGQDDTDSRWGNLPEQIENGKVVWRGKKKEKDLGAFFHGFGAGIVKRGCLNFQQTEAEDGSTRIRLSFQLTAPFAEQIFPAADEKVKALFERMPSSWGASGRYQLKIDLPEGGVFQIKDKIHERHATKVIVELKGDQGIEPFREVLKEWGVDGALVPFSEEDFEKEKLHFVFKFFYPGKADELKREGLVYALSLQELRERIVSMVPEMEGILAKYKVESMMLWPGRRHYSISAAEEIYGRGGRALTAMLGVPDKDGEEIPYDLSQRQLWEVANVMQQGMLSEKMRKKVGIKSEGLGGDDGAGRVYTQVIWKHEVDSEKRVEKLGYFWCGIVRVYISLDALNRGSYQYNQDLWGTKDNPTYAQRKNIFDFVEKFPFWRRDAIIEHEVLLPVRVFPHEIQGMSVPTEEMRQQLHQALREKGVAVVGADGIEHVNGIPLEKFVSIEARLPKDIIDRCAPSKTC